MMSQFESSESTPLKCTQQEERGTKQQVCSCTVRPEYLAIACIVGGILFLTGVAWLGQGSLVSASLAAADILSPLLSTLKGSLVSASLAAADIFSPLLTTLKGRYLVCAIMGILVLTGVCCIFIRCCNGVSGPVEPSLSPEMAQMRRATKMRTAAVIDILRNLPDVKDREADEENGQIRNLHH